jgi:head-tail adaptor
MQHTTSDGLVTVEIPAQAGWAVDATAVDADGAHVSAIKCKRTEAGEFFFAIAKDYTVAPASVCEPEELVSEIYPVLYAKMFASVTLVAVREMVIAGRVWCEADYRFVHPRLGDIDKRERVTVLDEHVLLVSGEGNPDAMRAHGAMLAAWLDGARFATLRAS